MLRFPAIVFCFALASFPCVAKETGTILKSAPGVEAVEANCAVCHSLAYIQMNSPFLSDTQWDAEVKKMIKVMGAPIDETDAKTISDYLKKNYGG